MDDSNMASTLVQIASPVPDPFQIVMAGEENSLMQHEIEFIKSQMESMDMSFLDDIPIADGLFYLDDKEKALYGETYQDDSDDESTVDLTVSVTSDADSGLDVSSLDDDNSIGNNKLSPPTRSQSEPPITVIERRRPMKQRPSLTRSLSSSLRRSFRRLSSIKMETLDDTKQRIHVAALRAKIRQQRLQNAEMKRQLMENLERERDMVVQIHQSNVATEQFHEFFQSADESHLQACLKSMRDEKRTIDAQRETFEQEADEIRAVLDANAKRLEVLRQERNQHAAEALKLELLIASTDLIPPTADQSITSVVELRMERDSLCAKLGLSDGESLDNDDESNDVEDSIEIIDLGEVTESIRLQQDNSKNLNALALSALQLEHGKDELAEQLAALNAQVGLLQATKKKQIGNIAALEANYAALTEEELQVLNTRTNERRPQRRRLLGRIFRRSR